MDKLEIARPEACVAVTGSGGSGAVTTGLILLAAVARAGHYGLLTRSAGPQIRGGESAAMVRFGPRPVTCMGDRFDILLGLDWNNIQRFVDELPLDANSLILTDSQGEPVPEILTRRGASVQPLPLKEIADRLPDGRLNMVALGALGALAGVPLSALEQGARTTIGAKGGTVLAGSLACIEAGYRTIRGEAADAADAPISLAGAGRWNISGNEAAGLGALRGGIRFVAAYPITPASEMLEWLAPRLELVGGSLLQAEDELASVNMIIGASFGGVPALTATSGPGLSLMMEGLGLAVASETPVVVANVQRGGPSTGIPTKSEQSDLNIALYGLHGDAPHLVLAPVSIGDCVFTFQWAVRLAEHLQATAIVLSDQSLGQSRAIVDPPPTFDGTLERRVETQPTAEYRRYAVTEGGISPMTLPGTPTGMYTADGLEHSPKGTPSSMARDHEAQLAKRLRKLTAFDYGPQWGEVHGAGPNCLLTWGSATGAVLEAAERLTADGIPTRTVALRLLAPLPHQDLAQALDGATAILVVEQNQGGQFFHYLHAQRALPDWARSLARPGPLPLTPGEIVRACSEGN
ncbi:MAG: 2-oxoacid:acceptor oxidoreductase subunit alpha [Bdellovibrio bacteriovorus]